MFSKCLDCDVELVLAQSIDCGRFRVQHVVCPICSNEYFREAITCPICFGKLDNCFVCEGGEIFVFGIKECRCVETGKMAGWSKSIALKARAYC